MLEGTSPLPPASYSVQGLRPWLPAVLFPQRRLRQLLKSGCLASSLLSAALGLTVKSVLFLFLKRHYILGHCSFLEPRKNITAHSPEETPSCPHIRSLHLFPTKNAGVGGFSSDLTLRFQTAFLLHCETSRATWGLGTAFPGDQALLRAALSPSPEPHIAGHTGPIWL